MSSPSPLDYSPGVVKVDAPHTLMGWTKLVVGLNGIARAIENWEDFNMRDYWPNPAIGQSLTVQDAYKSGVVDVPSKLARYTLGGKINGRTVVQLDEYNPPDNTWTDAWEYRFDPRGVLEVADKELNNVHKVFKSGNELNWGGDMAIGDVCHSDVIMDPAQSENVVPFVGTRGGMDVTLEAVFPTFTNPAGLQFENVIQILSYQWMWKFWPIKAFGKTVWKVRRWHAPKVGVVQIDYYNQKTGTFGRNYAQSITWGMI